MCYRSINKDKGNKSMSIRSMLQLLSYVSDTRKETTRNGTERLGSRLAVPLTYRCVSFWEELHSNR